MMRITTAGLDILREVARKYLWWKSPEEALAYPERIVAQVMDIGDFDDVQQVAAIVGDDILRAILTNAEPGQFTPRSWTYWHYRLGMAAPGQVPALPQRKLA
jgi:hypothetical protein